MNSPVAEDLGIKGRVFLKTVGDKQYVIIKGRAGLRSSLTGTRYLATNPKVIGLGLGSIGQVASTVRVGAVVVLAYVAVDALQAALSDEKDMADYVGKLGPDLAKGIAATGIGHLIAAIVVTLPIGLTVGIGISAGILAGLVLDAIIDEEIERQLAIQIREFLKSAQARARIEEARPFLPGKNDQTSP